MLSRPDLADEGAKYFLSHFDRPATALSWAPGRINIIGEHTDYNDGLALPAAVNRYVAMAVAARDDGKIHFQSHNYQEHFEIELSSLNDLKPTKHWHRYMVGTLRVFQDLGNPLSGMDVLLIGDIPAGSGLSSSAALVLAWLGALAEHHKVQLDPWTMVKSSQRVEHDYLGVLCGLLDQIGSQMSVANQVLAVDFQSLTVSPTSYNLPGYCWVAIHTGKSRELAESAYQTRVHECREALDRLKSEHPHIQTMRDVSAELVQGNDTLSKRIRHVVQENRRVEQAMTCIQNDAEGLGKLLDESHRSLRDDYEVSCDELNAMVEIATSQDGCVGARMMGGGFGGSTLNLVETAKAKIFVDETLIQYGRRYPQLKPSALIAELVTGAASLTI